MASLEGDTTLAWFETMSSPVPLIGRKPPTGGVEFALLSILCPQVLIIAHAIPFFGASYWTTYALVVCHLQSLLTEWWTVAEVCLRRRRARPWRETWQQHLQQLCGFILYWEVFWPWIPWFAGDFFTIVGVSSSLLVTIAKPFLHAFRREYVRAALAVLLSALPLVFDNDWFRDLIIYLVGTAVGFLCVAAVQEALRILTPQEIEAVTGPLMSLMAKEVIEIPEANLVQASVSALYHLNPERLSSDFPILIRYWDERSLLQQEGVDAGGVYRDWLCRVAQGLLSDEAGLFTTFTINGEELLKLRPPRDKATAAMQIQYATSAGRLLALSLKAKTSLGWALCEPLARLLLCQELPLLLSESQAGCPHRCDFGEHRARLRSLEIDTFTWLMAAVGEEEAKWYHDCLDTDRPLEARQALFDAVVHDSTDRSLYNLADHARDVVEKALIRDVAGPLWAFWDGFQSIPGACLPGMPSTRGCSVLQAQPKDWEMLAAHAFGSQEVDVDEWRQHTIVHTANDNGRQTAEWFWRFVRGLDTEGRRQLLFWWTAHRRPPHRGFQALPALTLHIRAYSGRLPVAHTCHYSVDLPTYSSFQTLSDKLRVAMLNTTFALS